MAIQKLFRNNLAVSPFADGKYWYLLEDFIWEPEAGEPITVLKGFVTDFASIPRPLWAILPTWAQYGPAAVVHDFLYWEQSLSRLRADEIMLEAMKDLKVSPLARGAIFKVLRLAGGYTWRENRKKKEGGYIKIITNFPENLSEPWESYRHKPQAFA
jgi:hypothetical protein